MADKKTWQPNEVQTEFLKVLENYPDGATLKDIELDIGSTFKTGAINVLITKGLITAADGEFVVDVVYREKVIGTLTKRWKVYKLVK